MKVMFAIVSRDVALAWRHGNTVMMALGFFIIAIALFPLSVGPDPAVLARISGGVVWVAALFSVMLSLERVFGPDYEDGSLEQLATLPMSLTGVALAKACAHWVTTALPLVLAAPFAAITLNMPVGQAVMLGLSLLIGTPALTLIGCLGAALTVGVRLSGVVLSLLIFPLYVPILIFGAHAIDAGGMSMGGGALQFLAAISLFAVVLAPPVTAAALRLAME